VVNSDEFKIASGVDTRIISEFGQVSSEVAQAMAEAVRIRLGADIGIGITGIEMTESAPSGIVYFGITDGRSSRASRIIIRARGKQRVVATVFSGLRKLLISRD
jgi:nicotinamide-nucleotide amidase